MPRTWPQGDRVLAQPEYELLACAGGFFAKDVDVLQRAAGLLLEQTMRQPTQFKRLLIARDAMAVADADARQALLQVRLLQSEPRAHVSCGIAGAYEVLVTISCPVQHWNPV